MDAFKFDLHPRKITVGMHTLTAVVKNRGDAVMRNLLVQLGCSETRKLQVISGEKFIYAIMPGHNALVHFDVNAVTNASVYVSVAGFRNCDSFFRFNSTHQKIEVK